MNSNVSLPADAVRLFCSNASAPLGSAATCTVPPPPPPPASVVVVSVVSVAAVLVAESLLLLSSPHSREAQRRHHEDQSNERETPHDFLLSKLGACVGGYRTQGLHHIWRCDASTDVQLS